MIKLNSTIKPKYIHTRAQHLLIDLL